MGTGAAGVGTGATGVVPGPRGVPEVNVKGLVKDSWEHSLPVEGPVAGLVKGLEELVEGLVEGLAKDPWDDSCMASTF